MPKAKKNGAFLHCYIRNDVAEILNQYCEETGYSKTAAVENALKEYLGIKDKKFVPKLDSKKEKHKD